ncbi:E-selectin CD62 antigen-like family member E Endothelial leukocyte adhesion molecule 1 [Larimichthys crocea]|uniref:E-selectin CD62 antigen-like family member E Endothelial leukocyte adhesion molecule 1 n=1 Tax=Larimichthys crocea TaxID=215358 RepID=A0A6G0HE26_LARCR|nr:E-selectin CD62 antigen-like family member E Endothelial leukocyte adhesion molecule 1 [Larimichthys crocea]
MSVTTGLCAVSSHAGRQYHFVYELKNWTEARSYCREKYTDLATIDNMEDMNTLNSMVDLSKMAEVAYKHRAWIGLYVNRSRWMWSLSNKDGETEFTNWYEDQPTSVSSGEHCTLMDESGRWHDDVCERSYKSVCMYVKGSDVTFFFINKTMTWTEAQNYCRTNYTDLASVRNMTENQKIQDLKGTEDKVWIGLFRDFWKWSDGSNSSFRYWKVWEPNNNRDTEACVAANFDLSGQWEDWTCDWKKEFICYSPPSTTKRVIKLRVLKKTSGQDLNDPAVNEQMLEQLRQRLKDHGVNPDDVKLSWRKQADGKVFHKVEKKTEKTEL